jgi:hypothetical protein
MSHHILVIVSDMDPKHSSYMAFSDLKIAKTDEIRREPFFFANIGHLKHRKRQAKSPLKSKKEKPKHR